MTSRESFAANPRELPRRLVNACSALLAVGAISFVGGLAADPGTAWRAFHVNFLFYGMMSQAALCLACAFVIIGARWTGPIRYVAEGLAAWVPISFLLFLVGNLGGREWIHSNWIHGAPYGKEGWLSFGRVFATDAAVLLVGTLLTVAFLRTSFRPTLKQAAESATRAKGMFERWTADWRGDEAEREASERRLKLLAPIICLVYVFGFTLVAFDQVMALEPTWFSNIFGWYFLWGGFLSAVAATSLICVLLRTTAPDWAAEITRPRMHDLGKMVFAFSIFWMYLFFAQYLVIWYGNLPEETQFLQARLGTQFFQDTWFWASERLAEPYVGLSLCAWVGCWVTPFWLLLGQRPKRTPAILGGVSAAVLVGFWFERNVLVWPAFVPEDGSAWLGPIQLGIALGFLGGFILVFLLFSRVFPTLPLPRRS